MSEPEARPSRFSGARALAFAGEFRGALALAAVFLLGVVFTPRNLATGQSIFLTWQTQSDILFEYSEYGLLACGMTLVILTGGIDLSVGSVLGFAATLFAVLLIGYGWSAPAALAIVAITGLAAGLVNGVLIARFRIQPFVATLAMMVAARGGAKLLSGGIKVQPGAQQWYALQGPPPDVFRWMTSPVGWLGLQPATLLFLLSIAVMLVVVRYTAYGRRLYAVGGSEEAARLSGIRVGAVKIVAYSLCALFAAIAGAVNACRIQIGDPEAGGTYELDAIAAVVIGGTSLSGGQGGMFLTLIGTLIIAYINKILSINNVPEAYRLLAKGLIIVAAVLIQRRKQ
ncbi:MAG: ribose ABC transporter [Armatimonadota bacterium]|nr:MAG: ribose ABC transporter [Armatimonadota bacterium]